MVAPERLRLLTKAPREAPVSHRGNGKPLQGFAQRDKKYIPRSRSGLRLEATVTMGNRFRESPGRRPAKRLEATVAMGNRFPGGHF